MFDPAPILSGDRRALARLLTQIENVTPLADEALAALYPHTGRAHLIGMTGAPGTGKSSLVNELTKAFRQAGRTVAILAVDPTSPFTGGAILGDRIRMRDLSGDAGVFIRSMATRGALGGLARATADVVKALDAAGFDKVIIETVGAGQAEVDIARTAHTTVVVEAPGLGDEVQGIKAGILEIADVLVVNKSDQPGADAALRALRVSLELASPLAARVWRDLPTQLPHHLPDPEPMLTVESSTRWSPPILQTIAVQGQGIAELMEAIERHRAYLDDSGTLHQRERERLAFELEARVRDALFAQLLAQVGHRQLDHILDKLQRREIDPHTAARQLIG
jgi:LAO/AO transport system kinase